ncbi:MAG: hypothetical protein QHH24_05420 [Candidatus Bathyarchaeota archaeon]|jgi:hypothetical protein|nr:hypothetical protein [Candidatus Bathyarchaeota archaeon]
MTPLEMLLIAVWSCLVAYVTWYATSAKHYAPITPQEARLLWKIHVQLAHCNGKRWREMRRGGKTVGFECECGYKHLQKRPIVGSLPSLHVTSEKEKSVMFDRLHSSYG